MGVTRHWNVGGIKTLIFKGAKHGTLLCAEHLLEESQKLVPVDTGRLKLSGNVRETASGHIVEYSVDSHSNSDFDYAIIQHELPMNHPNGGQDHYLSTPAELNSELYAEILAMSLRDAL